MEKPASKSKNKILKFLPKAAAVSFQNLPFSPRGRDKRPDLNAQRLRAHQNKGFSAPIVPMIPAEARRKSKNFETQEPTSPKVSCMGQIKQKNKNCKISKKKQASLRKEFKPEKIAKVRPTGSDSKMKKKQSGIKKIFSAGRKDDDFSDEGKPPIENRAPSLCQMRRFASSRDTFANFDWKSVRISPEEDRELCSDEERGYSDEEDDVIIPFSAPILMAGGGGGAGSDVEPRKEINLWKRRTMAQPQPQPLQLG